MHSTGGDGGAPPDMAQRISCTLQPVLVAKALFNAGTMGAINTPGSLGVVGLLSGGNGPFYASWNDGLHEFDSPRIDTDPSQWDATFQYDMQACDPSAPTCPLTVTARYVVNDTFSSTTFVSPVQAEADLCIDLNRNSATCPLPVSLETVTATQDAGDPATLHFSASLTHPELDCSGTQSSDGLFWTWNVHGIQYTTPDQLFHTREFTATYTDANANGQFYYGDVDVHCRKSWVGPEGPGAVEMHATTQFYVSCVAL